MRLRSNLKPMLDVKGISIREFSRRIDYRLNTVRGVYSNTIRRIPVDFIERACEELHCTVGELLYVSDEDESGDK